MEYIHVRNLEKYHPGYKDRVLSWAKIYINMADGDPDTELIENEVDWARLIKIILLELRAQKPVPNLDAYWNRKGFNLKNRPMSLTLQMLHNFLDIVTEKGEVRYGSVTQIREEKSRVDKINIDLPVKKADPDIKIFLDFWFIKYQELLKTKYFVNGGKDSSLIKLMLSTYKLDELKLLVEKFLVSKDEFTMKAGYTIGVFHSQINKLAAAETEEYKRRERQINLMKGKF